MSNKLKITKSKTLGKELVIGDFDKKYQTASKLILLTARATAKAAGYSEEHFSRLKGKGDHPKITKRGGRDLYTIAAVKEWGKSHGIEIADIDLKME